MSRRPSIPERYSSLMPENRQKSLQSKQRDFSQICGFSRVSVASSTVSEFLEEKIRSYQLEIDYLRTYKDGLYEAKEADTIKDTEYKPELNSVLDDLKQANEDLRLVKRQRSLLEDDLQDELRKRQKDDTTGPDKDFLERAYTNVIVPRVMGALSKQKKSKFNQSAFRKDVLEFYSAVGVQEHDGKKEEFAAYCHLTGWTDPESVKAAHLVPKSLTEEEIGYLFGTKELIRSDPRNGISLHKKLETGLDDGSIAIVPVPENNSEYTRWRCILVDDSRKRLVCLRQGDNLVRWEDFDGKELVFLGTNRPSRRYLYFRFIVTYLHAKNTGNTSFTEKVEDRNRFWASPGPYLRHSTLISLARNISGCDLPPSLLEDTTFKSTDMEDDDDDISTMLSVQLRDAIIESTVQREKEEDSGDSEDSEESDC
ncbi:hypothetical protein DTO282E5_669 [Paecilomyces variotii]|nr:hypothetical protein DTO282E5_669 [Paecilomyces variotii]